VYINPSIEENIVVTSLHEMWWSSLPVTHLVGTVNREGINRYAVPFPIMWIASPDGTIACILHGTYPFPGDHENSSVTALSTYAAMHEATYFTTK
jgi:hypothetical protein